MLRSVGERFKLAVNGAPTEIDASGDTPLLYALRNDLALKGTRFGCGSGRCGACFVLIDGHAAPACDTPLWSAAGKSITTVEGLGHLRAVPCLCSVRRARFRARRCRGGRTGSRRILVKVTCKRCSHEWTME